MNCQSFKNQIDEAGFTAELHRHLAECTGCRTFQEERECLKTLLAKLETVEAPANFEFGVKAKLNSLPAGNDNRVWIRRFAFASPALAAVAVSAFFLTNYNVFSTSEQTTSPVAQTANVAAAPIVVPSPSVAPTQMASANTNVNTDVVTPISPKPTISVVRNDDQLAVQSSPLKQPRVNTPKRDREVMSGTIEEKAVKTIDSGVKTAPPPLFPTGFDTNQKVAANKALSFFGMEVSDDGSVKSVQTNSAASENGITAGDKIENVNGQKIGDANLESPLQQITVEVSRDGNKRKVTMSVKAPAPK
jgi:membrane-associated protease RseP (regulator of RpoE activity)